MKRYEKSLHKKARWMNHHIFSMRCRDEGLIPASLRIKPPVRTKEGYKIAEKATRAFLSARIPASYLKKANLEDELCGVLKSQTWELWKKSAEKTHSRVKNSSRSPVNFRPNEGIDQPNDQVLGHY